MPVVALPAAAVRPLRRLVLRPHQAIDELVFGGDDHPLALHAGNLVDGALVAVGSIAPEPHPVEARVGDWRLRGMATIPEARGGGRGADVLAACVEHARAHGGRRIWCNARTGAIGFYERHGFAGEGERFDIAGIGSHLRMTLDL